VERYEEFLDFIQKVLVYSPEERYSPTQGLAHPYILYSQVQEGEPAGASSTTANASGGSSSSSSAKTNNQDTGTAAMDVSSGESRDIGSSQQQAAAGSAVAAATGAELEADSQMDDTSTGDADSLLSSEQRGRLAAAQHRIRSKSAPSVRSHAHMSNTTNTATSRNVRRQVSGDSYIADQGSSSTAGSGVTIAPMMELTSDVGTESDTHMALEQ